MSKRTLLLIAGHAGSGKSMVGKIIASKLRAPYLDMDSVSLPVLEKALELTVGDPNDRQSDFFCENFKPLVYKCTMDLAWENLKLLPNVVAVGPFVSRFKDAAWVAEVDRQARKINASWHVVWVYSSPDAMKRLLQARRTPRDEWKLSHWDEFLKTVPDKPNLPFDNYTVLANDARNLRELESDIDAMLKKLELQ